MLKAKEYNLNGQFQWQSGINISHELTTRVIENGGKTRAKFQVNQTLTIEFGK